MGTSIFFIGLACGFFLGFCFLAIVMHGQILTISAREKDVARRFDLSKTALKDAVATHKNYIAAHRNTWIGLATTVSKISVACAPVLPPDVRDELNATSAALDQKIQNWKEE